MAALLALSAPAAAASLEGRSLRIGAGAVWPEGVPATPWLLAAARVRLLGLSFEPEAGFWSRSETAFGLRSSLRDVQLGASLTWSALRLGRTRLMLGTGAAAHLVTSTASAPAGPSASETSVRPGVQAWAAFEVPLGARTAAFAASRYDRILRADRDDEDELRVYAGVRLGF